LSISNQQIKLPLLREKGLQLYLKREDALHPLISGNKFRKLRYNLLEAKVQGRHTLLSFGGAHSNHIAALACAGMESGFGTIGVIRGEELEFRWRDNPTLSLAHGHGMRFHFVSRSDYRKRGEPDFIEGLRTRFGEFHLLPEGGSNALGVRGCEEILGPGDARFDLICCAVGTGATLAGISNSSLPHQKVLGFPALKGDFLDRDIHNFVHRGRWELVDGFHFGGYARVDRELVEFINRFKKETGIPLDPIYTGKMLFGIFALIKEDQIRRGSKILAIHTGGLQGIAGMNLRLGKRNLPLIDL